MHVTVMDVVRVGVGMHLEGMGMYVAVLCSGHDLPAVHVSVMGVIMPVAVGMGEG